MGSPKMSKPSSEVVHVNNLQILVASQSSYEKTRQLPVGTGSLEGS